MKIKTKNLSLYALFVMLSTKLVSDYSIYVLGKDPTRWGRYVTVTVLLFIVALIFQVIPNRHKLNKNIVTLLTPLLTFWAITALTSYINDGEIRHVSSNMVVMTTLVLIGYYDDEINQKQIRMCVLFLTLQCIASLWGLANGLGYDATYSSGVFKSVLSIRLSGTQWHANTLGGLSAATVICGAYFHDPIVFVIGLVTCVLTQSKAALIGLAVSLYIFYYSRIKYRWLKYVILMVVVLASFYLIVFVQPLSGMTFTGRTKEWSLFLSEWKSSLYTMIFGVKQTALGGYNLSENQYIQSLCKNGILGGIAFAFLIIKLFTAALKSFKRGSKLSMLLLLMILARCCTESYFSSLAHNDAYFLLLILIYKRDIYRNNYGIAFNYGDTKIMRIKKESKL